MDLRNPFMESRFGPINRISLEVCLVLILAVWSPNQTVPAEGIQRVRLNVPFLHQATDRDCGPTSLMILLKAMGYGTSRNTVDQVMDLYHGTLPAVIDHWLDHRSIRHERVRPQSADLMKTLDAGRPVMVLWNRSKGFRSTFHYVVVVGYERSKHKDTSRVFLVHDGKHAFASVGFKRFMRWWSRAHYWSEVIMDRGTKSTAPK